MKTASCFDSAVPGSSLYRTAQEKEKYMRRLLNLAASVAVALLSISTVSAQPPNAGGRSTSTPIHDIDNPARQPVSIQFDIQVQPGFGRATKLNIYQVPVGKRLIINYIGLFSRIPATEEIVAIKVTTGASQVTPTTSLATAVATNSTPFTTFPGDRAVIISQSVFMFANPGDQVSVAIDTNKGPEGADLNQITLNGYLVDLP
jgi:hypothetical protein